MKRPHLVRGLTEAWYSKALYAEVGGAWRGAGLLYMLGLTALLALPIAIVAAVDFHHFVVTDAPRFVNQVPTIRLRAGHASTTAPTPCILRDPATGKAVVVIDPAGRMSELPDGAPAALLTDSHFIVRRNALETRVFDLARAPDMTIDAAGVMRVLHGLELLLPVLLFAVVVPFKWAWNECFALLLAAGGLLIVRSMPVRPPFVTLLRIATVALTPLLVVDAVLDLAHAHLPLEFVLQPALGLGCTWLALRAYAGEGGAGGAAGGTAGETIGEAATPADEASPGQGQG